MAAKPQKQTASTLVVSSPLATAFLNLADNRQIEIHDVEGLGKVGLKELSIGLRDDWSKIKEDSVIWLVQNTVCDPDTGELVLQQIDVARLKEIPSKIFDAVVSLVFKQNGFKTVSEIEAGAGSKELKNLETSQN